jgi:hypothetical protein
LSGRRAEQGKYSADCIVFLSILNVLVAGDLPSHGAWGRQAVACGLRPSVLQYLAAAGLGPLVGFAELVSDYGDEPWRVAIARQGLIFIGLNGLAGCFALCLLQVFPNELHAPANPVLLVVVGGFGAMVVIRTKLLTVHQPGGTDVAVGPAFLPDTLVNDESLKYIPDQLKFAIAGTSILAEFGDRTFDGVFTSLKA